MEDAIQQIVIRMLYSSLIGIVQQHFVILVQSMCDKN